MAVVSGLFVSKTLIPAISVSGHLWVHELHTVSSYAGFILAGAHLGLHWRALLGRASRWLGVDRERWAYLLVAYPASALVIGCGVHAWSARGVGPKLLLESASTSWGASPSWLDFVLDHPAILGGYALLTYGLSVNLSSRVTRWTRKAVSHEAA